MQGRLLIHASLNGLAPGIDVKPGPLDVDVVDRRPVRELSFLAVASHVLRGKVRRALAVQGVGMIR
jgi:hypothetical protein